MGSASQCPTTLRGSGGMAPHLYKQREAAFALALLRALCQGGARATATVPVANMMASSIALLARTGDHLRLDDCRHDCLSHHIGKLKLSGQSESLSPAALQHFETLVACLLYTSDAADDM
eukprot:3512333-Rhodomonas_salina.3